MHISVLLVILTSSSLLTEADSKKILRDTNYGRVRGFQTKLAQVFYGIPYAAPAQRWTDPSDPSGWTGRRDCTQKKPMCYQTGVCNDALMNSCLPTKAEDCLYLNIFAPLKTRTSSKKVVMVWIHGGSFSGGTGAAEVFDGQMFVNKGNVIMVTINYRLGAFGFLVTGNTSNDITGNYGLKDQRQALKWVNENIHHFGGDPEKIMARIGC